MQKIHIFHTNFIKVVFTFYLHRLSLYPFAVFYITALCGDFTDIDLRVEICSEWITVVAVVAVENVYIVYFIEVMLLCICRIYACNAGVKSTAEYCCDTSLFKTLSVCPLPFIFKFSGIFRFIICCIKIVRFGFKTSVHYSKILIGESDIYYYIRLLLIYKLYKLRNAVCIDLSCSYFCRCFAGKFFFEFITF